MSSSMTHKHFHTSTVPTRHAVVSMAGQEVGFYAGCVRTWRLLAASDPALVPERQERGLAALEAMLAAFPLYDPQAR